MSRKTSASDLCARWSSLAKSGETNSRAAPMPRAAQFLHRVAKTRPDPGAALPAAAARQRASANTAGEGGRLPAGSGPSAVLGVVLGALSSSAAPYSRELACASAHAGLVGGGRGLPDKARERLCGVGEHPQHRRVRAVGMQHRGPRVQRVLVDLPEVVERACAAAARTTAARSEAHRCVLSLQMARRSGAGRKGGWSTPRAAAQIACGP